MKTLLTAMMIFGATTASAGERVVGNGGNVVFIGERLYLLDLYESGESTKIPT